MEENGANSGEYGHNLHGLCMGMQTKFGLFPKPALSVRGDLRVGLSQATRGSPLLRQRPSFFAREGVSEQFELQVRRPAIMKHPHPVPTTCGAHIQGKRKKMIWGPADGGADGRTSVGAHGRRRPLTPGSRTRRVEG